MSEGELVRHARAGDVAAWEQLVLAHQEAVFRLAYLILGDPADAQDAAQDALIRAYRALDGFDESRPLRPWLLTIVANQARNRRRAAWRYIQALQRGLLAEPDAAKRSAPDPADQGDGNELWQAVRRLNPADQEVIYLRYFLELPVSEAAQTLGVPDGTVKSRLNRALARLREVIQRDFPTLQEDALS